MTAADTVPLTIVAAVADNGVIGRDNALPWRLGTDLARFKRITLGKALVMGRRNWDSIGRPLPGRRTVVLTRDAGFRADGADIVHSWHDALATARRLAGEMDADEIVIAGGAEIYRLAMPDVARLRLTEVHAAPPGDTLFPPFDRAFFGETFRERHTAAAARDDHDFSFVDLERRRERRQA